MSQGPREPRGGRAGCPVPQPSAWGARARKKTPVLPEEPGPHRHSSSQGCYQSYVLETAGAFSKVADNVVIFVHTSVFWGCNLYTPEVPHLRCTGQWFSHFHRLVLLSPQISVRTS